MVIMSYEAGCLAGATLQHFFPEPTGAWRQWEEGLAKGSSQQPEFVGPAQRGPVSQGHSWLWVTLCDVAFFSPDMMQFLFAHLSLNLI